MRQFVIGAVAGVCVAMFFATAFDAEARSDVAAAALLAAPAPAEDEECFSIQMQNEEVWFEFFRVAFSFSEDQDWKNLLESEEFREYWVAYQSASSSWKASQATDLAAATRARSLQAAKDEFREVVDARRRVARKSLVGPLGVADDLDTIRRLLGPLPDENQ
jgi:hypothetical protein